MRRPIQPLEKLGYYAGMLALILMMTHIFADVVMRNVFNWPLNGVTEIVSAYYMIGVIFLPLSYATRQEGHLFVEVFTRNLSERKKAALDLFAGCITLTFLGLFFYASLQSAMKQTARRESWEAARTFVEVWPSRWFLAFAAFLLIFLTLSSMRTCVRTLFRTGREE